MKAIKLYPNDTVALATDNLKKGEVIELDGQQITLLDDVPKAHKIALRDFAAGDDIIKYDNIIGTADVDIKKGEWVNEHKEHTNIGEKREYTYNFNKEAIWPGTSDKTFNGYKRYDGRVGIRNHLLILSAVFCANGPVRHLGELAKAKYPATENFDGVIDLTQEYGCSQTGPDLERQCRVMASITRNPNFGGVLIVSLGCEVGIPKEWLPYMGDYNKDRIKIITIQEVEDEFETGMQMIDEIMEHVSKDVRTPQPMSELHIAMNCGGSDGYSGITANTLLGRLCDRIVQEGGTMNMTEVPEMMGAEHILMNRAADEKVFHDIVGMMYNYIDYCDFYGEKPYENPTQGNKAGGLSTLEEKSLGCIQKGGHCVVSEVVQYGDRATKKGFLLVYGPGNDIAGITGQIAAGAVLTIFTTGRGTPAGFAGPLFRLASNTELATRKKNWIDFDGGRLLTATPEEADALVDELYDMILATCNGEYSPCAERNGYYQVGIWKHGATM